MLRTKIFSGANVFMSRNLVPPELFDALLDALKHNGAEVFTCCDPSRNSSNDYHVIASSDHEKFEDLRAKGCKLLGPNCVLTCAKERIALPKQGFTCCLAFNGVKIALSGFNAEEKVKIEKMVTEMGGLLNTKSFGDSSFVIVKNVLAAKYKGALHSRKPIVTVNWLSHCWNEHHVVPHESYIVLPFTGLTICVSGIPGDERRKVKGLIVQNGGMYSAELIKSCTHLISDAPEGDKYKAATRWGHIHVVNRKWLDQSIERRACLNEESYPVLNGLVPSKKTRTSCFQDRDFKDQSAQSSMVAESNIPAVSGGGYADPDLETTFSQNLSSMFAKDSASILKEDVELPTAQTSNGANFDGCVANDSESEENDLYLSECRIFLIGFEAAEMRKLVNLVRRGGGSRYMFSDERLTHIIVGTPSEVEKKEARGLAALGMINVVRTNWLEDCDCVKKEVTVMQKHVAHDLLLPKEPINSTRGVAIGMISTSQIKTSTVCPSRTSDQLLGNNNSVTGVSLQFGKQKNHTLVEMNKDGSRKATVSLSEQIVHLAVNNQIKGHKRMQHVSTTQDAKSSNVFKGKCFRFSISFPEDRRAEIVEWINQGGGKLIDDQAKHSEHYTIGCHGVAPRFAGLHQTTHVSSHWIRSCLADGSLLDIESHILYSPLPCEIPLPGFVKFRFCVSQYDEKDKVLLRNLCFVLGAKFSEKLIKNKVTHLLCKFSNGPKYEAACRWGIKSVTSEWIYECVKQNKVTDMDPFCPKQVTIQDQEAGFCTVSQFPTQAAQIMSEESLSQLRSQTLEFPNTVSQITSIGLESSTEMTKQSSFVCKKARVLKNCSEKGILLAEEHANFSTRIFNSNGDDVSKDNGDASHVVRDVAAAIEDLLEQTSKIHDQKSPERTRCNRSLFSSDCAIFGQENGNSHSVVGLSKHWLNRTLKQDEGISKASEESKDGAYYGFSETQTDSQVVSYEEDLTGRQMLIDRVRTRSSLT